MIGPFGSRFTRFGHGAEGAITVIQRRGAASCTTAALFAPAVATSAFSLAARGVCGSMQ